MRYKTGIALCSAALLASASARAEVLYVCGSPEGLASHFPGKVVAQRHLSLAEIVEGETLVKLVRDGGRFDVILEHASGKIESARHGDGQVTGQAAMGGNVHHIVVSDAAAEDHFLFNAAQPGKETLLWASKAMDAGEGLFASAICAAPGVVIQSSEANDLG